MDVVIAIDLILKLIARAQQVSSLIAAARAEGRDTLNKDEIAVLLAQDSLARSELEAAMEKAESENR